jgi:predicted short-subunit dehydrogenase-like oxidoreductase (DUF2520 family)
MLPGMDMRPRIAIVGAGNLATVLAVSLRKAGYEIGAIISRSRAESFKKARSLARKVGAQVWSDPPEGLRAEVIWFCVPDAEIASAAKFLAKKLGTKVATKIASKAGSKSGSNARLNEGSRKRVALHSSGALSSDELAALREQGMAVGSVHPLMTFVRDSRPSLAGVSFAVEGDAAALRVARRLVKDLGGNTYTIRPEDKAAYHAWGTFASPLLTALLVTSEQVAGLAGVRPASARRRMLPILHQTLENYAEFGAARGFSGPIMRGDLATLARHLRALRGEPAAREVYLALARAALHYLPAKNRAALKKLLDPLSERFSARK